jgi:hypothetical protein
LKLRRLAAVAAVNRLHSRSFRERGLRRENVKDLVDDLELLFLKAGVVEEETKRRIFVGFVFSACFPSR